MGGNVSNDDLKLLQHAGKDLAYQPRLDIFVQAVATDKESRLLRLNFYRIEAW